MAFHLLVWSIVLLLFLSWSLLAWLTHWLASWEGWSGAGLTGWPDWVAKIKFPDWLAQWLPPGVEQALRSVLEAMGPLVEFTAGLLPGIAAWLPTLVTGIWFIGAFFLLLLGGASSLLIRFLVRKSRPVAATQTNL